MRTLPVLTILAALLISVATPSLGSKPEPPSPCFVPDPALTEAPYAIVGRAIDVTQNGVRVRIEPLDDASRKTWFAIHTNFGVDPIPTRAQRPRVPTVFSVSIENGSASTLSYTPSLSQLMRDKDLELLPINEDQIFDYLRAGMAGNANPEQAATKALQAFHASRLTLEPGQRATKLLLFEAAPARSDRVILLLDQLTVGIEELRLAFLFLSEEEAARSAGKPRGHDTGTRQ